MALWPDLLCRCQGHIPGAGSHIQHPFSRLQLGFLYQAIGCTARKTEPVIPLGHEVICLRDALFMFFRIERVGQVLLPPSEYIIDEKDKFYPYYLYMRRFIGLRNNKREPPA